MSKKGVSMRSGSAHKRAKAWFNISDEDWKLMRPSIHQTHINAYRSEIARYKWDLKQLGYSRYVIGYIIAMRAVGYVFDAIDSHRMYIHFWYDGGSTYFTSWRHVKAWLNEYGR